MLITACDSLITRARQPRCSIKFVDPSCLDRMVIKVDFLPSPLLTPRHTAGQWGVGGSFLVYEVGLGLGSDRESTRFTELFI